MPYKEGHTTISIPKSLKRELEKTIYNRGLTEGHDSWADFITFIIEELNKTKHL